MKKIVFLTYLTCFSVFAQEVRVTKAMEREVFKSVEQYFASINKNVKDVWGLTAYLCEDRSECLYYVDSYAHGQHSYSYAYGTQGCRTWIKKAGNRLAEDGTDCELIGD